MNDPLIEAITPKTPWYVVLRPFEGDGGRLIRGEVVDTTAWKYHQRLVDLRYVAPLPHGVDVPKPNADGRRVIDLSDQQAESVPEKKRPEPARKSK